MLESVRSLAVAVAAFSIVVSSAGAALAEEVVVNFTGTVSVPSGNLNGPILAGHTISGTLTYESVSAGVYTPSPNPMFVRAEMLYTGAIVSGSFLHEGVNAVSGTGGDILIYDSLDAMFGGDDSFEATASMTTGSIGAVPIESIFVNPNFGALTWTLSPGDDVPIPLEDAQSTGFNQFLINSVGGGTAYGSIDSYEVIGGGGGGDPVPVLHGLGVLGLAGALGGVGGLAARRRRSRA